MIEAKKSLPAAPYVMYMIERVTKVTFPKTIKHEPLHLRSRFGDAPPLPPSHAGATRNSRYDPAHLLWVPLHRLVAVTMTLL